MKALIFALLLSHSAHAQFSCGAVTVGGWYAISQGPADWNTGTGILNGLAPAGALGDYYSFQNVVPAGGTFFMTKIKFQTKGLPNRLYPGGIDLNRWIPETRNSYFVFGSKGGGFGTTPTMWTCTDREGSCDFDPPIPLRTGFDFRNGQILNNSSEAQNMLFMVQGFYRDASCPSPTVSGFPIDRGQ